MSIRIILTRLAAYERFGSRYTLGRCSVCQTLYLRPLPCTSLFGEGCRVEGCKGRLCRTTWGKSQATIVP